MEDIVMYFLIWFFGTAAIMLAVGIALPAPYQLKIAVAVLIGLSSFCGVTTFIISQSWTENWPWFFICGGFFFIFIFAVSIWAWRAYSRNAKHD